MNQNYMVYLEGKKYIKDLNIIIIPLQVTYLIFALKHSEEHYG